MAIETPQPVAAGQTVVLQPDVPLTLQLTIGAVTIKATLNVSANGNLNVSVDSKLTADSNNPI